MNQKDVDDYNNKNNNLDCNQHLNFDSNINYESIDYKELPASVAMDRIIENKNNESEKAKKTKRCKNFGIESLSYQDVIEIKNKQGSVLTIDLDDEEAQPLIDKSYEAPATILSNKMEGLTNEKSIKRQTKKNKEELSRKYGEFCGQKWGGKGRCDDAKKMDNLGNFMSIRERKSDEAPPTKIRRLNS